MGALYKCEVPGAVILRVTANISSGLEGRMEAGASTLLVGLAQRPSMGSQE